MALLANISNISINCFQYPPPHCYPAFYTDCLNLWSYSLFILYLSLFFILLFILQALIAQALIPLYLIAPHCLILFLQTAFLYSLSLYLYFPSLLSPFLFDLISNPPSTLYLGSLCFTADSLFIVFIPLFYLGLFIHLQHPLASQPL